MGLTNVDIELLAGLNLQSSEQEILKAIQILQKNLQVNEQAKIKLDVQIDQAKLQQIVSILQQLAKRSDLSTSTQQSINNITKEATQLTSVAKATEQVIQKKKELSSANKEVAKSAKDAETNIGKQISGMNMNASASSVQRIVNQLNHMNNTVAYSHSIFGNLKNAISHTFSSGKLAMTSYLAVLRGISTAAKDAKEAITELNQAETDLMIATNMSRESVKGLIKDYNTYGKQLASTTKNITDAADDYLRAGKTLNESQALIKDSIMLSKLGQIDSDEATEDLLATANGFNMAADEVEKALDAMVSIDMVASTNAGSIAEMLKYSASSADIAGVSFNKLVAILGTVQDRTMQSNSVVGTFANQILARYRDVTIGKYLTDDGEDISNYESVLKSVGIELRDSQGEFRTFEDVLEDMATAWGTLTSVQQNALLKVTSGTRQMNRMISLLENYDKVLELTEVAANSAGIAVEKFNNSYMTSLEAKQNTLQASFESMIYNVNMDEVYGDILDATTAMVEFIDKANLLKGAMTGLTVGVGIKGFLALKSGIHSAYISLNQFHNALNMVKQTNISNKDFKTLLLLTNGLSDSQTKLILSSKNLTLQQRQQILIAQGLSTEEAKLKLQTWGLTSAQTGLTASTTSLKNALSAMWTMMLSNPIFLIISGITLATSAFSTYKHKIEEVRQATADAATTYEESSKSIDDYISRYQELQQALEDAKGDEEATVTVKEQLLELQNELNDAYGTEYGKLNLVTDAYKDQTEAIKELSKAEANRYLNENRQGISTATKKMEKEREYVVSYGNLSFTKKGKMLEELAEEYGMEIETNSVSNEIVLVVNATAEEAYETINAFESDLRKKAIELGDEHLFDDVLEISSSALNKAKSVVDEYGEIYHQALMAELVTNDGASEVYQQALSAVEEYNQAVAESSDPYNDAKVAKAKANVEAVKAQVEDSKDILGKFSSMFDDVFEQADTRLLDFNEKLKSDTSMQEWANQLKGLSQTEILSMADDGTEDTFDQLVASAEEYDLTVEQLIDTLIRLGYVQGEVTDAGNTVAYNTIDLQELNDQIDSIQSAYKGLSSACEEYNQYGYITADTLQTLLNLDGQYLACLINENGQLAINGQTYQALVEAKLADAEATAVQQAIEELGTITTEQQIQADTTAIGVMAQKGTALATLTEQYAYLANVAISAAQAQALADAYTDASNKNQAEADKIMSNLNAKLALIQSTAKNTSGSFGALNNHLNGFSNASAKASDSTDELTKSMERQKEALEDQKDALEKQKQHYEDVSEAVNWFYDTQIEKQEDAIENLEKQNDLIQEHIDMYDGALSSIDRFYEKQIDAIQERIDALDEENDANERAIALEKAKQALEEARNKRTIQLYTKDKGFVYTTDQSAIREAEDNLAQIEHDNERDKIKADLQAEIDKIKEYRDLWAEIPSIKQQAEEDSQMIELLGAEWESILLEGRIENISSFKDQYIALQQQIDNNDGLIASYEEKIVYYESLKEQWDALTSRYEEDTYRQLLIGEFGNDYENILLNGRTERWEQFADDYYNIQVELKNVTDQIEALVKRMEEYAKKIESAANDAANAIVNLANIPIPDVPSSDNTVLSGGGINVSARYAKGTRNAKKGIAEVAEEGAEMITNGETAVVASEHTLVNFKGGETVYPADVTKRILAGDGLMELGMDGLSKMGLSREQYGAVMHNRVMGMLTSGIDFSKFNTATQMQSLIRPLSVPETKINNSTNITIGDIHNHNVQDVDGFAKVLKQKLPMVMEQKLGKRI